MSSNIEHQFSVDSEGWLHEVSVLNTRDSLSEATPGAELTSIEAEFMLLRTARLITLIRDAHWAEHGLTYSRVVLLRQLYTAGDRGLNMSEIAATMNLGSNSVTQLVDSLTQRGLVQRSPGGQDKRIVIVTLTEQGRHLTQTVLPDNVKRIADAWSPLNTSERKALSHFLAKVRLHLLMNNSVLDQNPLTSAADSVQADVSPRIQAERGGAAAP